MFQLGQWEVSNGKRDGSNIMQYTVIIEKGETSYGASVPDLPGCIAVGESHEEVLQLIQEGIEFHIEGLRAEGTTIPQPIYRSELVEVKV